MERRLKILKREIGSTELAQIRELIESSGKHGRTCIAKHLCQVWDWRLPKGQLRDIACRDLLRRLENGLIHSYHYLDCHQGTGEQLKYIIQCRTILKIKANLIAKI